jgi:AraC-like DNA-binding protein
MTGSEFWLQVVVAFFCMLGFIVSLILFAANKNKSFASRILGSILFCLSYVLFGYLLYISGEFLRLPHFFRTPAFFSLCIAPLTYIYVRSSLEQILHFKKRDILFFIPAVLYTAQFIPFYMLSADEKIPFISMAMENKSFGAREPEGLLPQGVGFVFRMVYSLSLIIYTYITLIQWKSSTKRAILTIGDNKEIFRWYVYFTIVLSSTFFILIVSFLFQVTHFLDQYRVSTLTLTLSIFFICFYLLLKPDILYGLKSWLPIHPIPFVVNPNETSPVTDEVVVKNRQSLTHVQIVDYKQLIEVHFINNRPFLKQRYAIKDLANEMGIPSYLLSAFINQEYGINFSEFINDIRVSYLIDLVKQNPDYLSKYTLEVLGEMGGFNSRTAFILAVKRKTGKPPSEVFGKS